MSRPPSSWRRAARGLLVVGIGVFLLLNTTGWLPWSFWLELLPFWPVVLVAAGVRLVFERSRLPALTLLSPVVVLGTMGWVAASTPGLHRPSGPRITLAAERPAGLERWRLAGSVGYGELHVEAAAPDAPGLVAGEAVTARAVTPLRVHASGGEARVRFGDTRGRRVVAFGMPSTRWSRWDMDIAGDLPLDLDLDLALAEGRLDLESVRIGSLAVEGAFNDVTVTLDRPEADVRLFLEGAFNRFTLEVPPDVPVRVATDGFLNLADDPVPGQGPGYRVRLEGAFNSLGVERAR